MKHAEFVHLHNHSDYSLLDGASPIPRMVERAAELKMPAVAITDHGAMFGVVPFYQACRKAGVKPLLGMEAYVTRGSRKDRNRDTAHHLVLLARDEQGFRNLMKLSSLAFLEGFYYKPRVDHEVLNQHRAGLLALSACPKGEVATDLLEDNEDGALRTAMMYRDLFGPENYFLEIQNHGLEMEEKIRARVRALAGRTGIPLIATNDCHYLRREDADAHDILLCIQTGKTVHDTKRMNYQTDQLYFATAEEMQAKFPDTPEALANTLAVAERCDVQLSFGKPLLPEFPLPPEWASAHEYLRDLAWKGLNERFPGRVSDEMRQRFTYELDVICRMGFASYFLIVRDFIDFARRNGIGVGPGRGSVAGSLVAYALRITDIDPLEHGLIFERFLNPERVTMPDIDIDFDDLRRGEVIEYVRGKYGDGNVTQIITFGTMGAKGVVRDVGRALGLPVSEVDKIARLVPDGLGMTLDKALEQSPDLKALPQRGAEHDRLLRSARVLEGCARHASTHAAGVLITPGPLVEYVPLYRQKDGSVTTQWDMKAVEKAGLLKMDFLGLRTLSVLQEAVDLVRDHHGVSVDLAKLPMDDAATYKVFQDADTVAIFQFESGGMRDHLKRLKPTVFGDLVAMNALYRPGPMENIPYFIDCKHGRQVVRYEDKGLEPILATTYGVFVYQEQVMEAAHKLAGFSLSQADELRRAMGKKKVEEMEAKRKAFIDGCAERNMPRAKAEKIFATMEKFAGYGFNKCVVSDTELVDADTGEVVTVGQLYESGQLIRVHALDDGWKLGPRRVTHVVRNGKKPVFEMRTELGARITATANHPFRTLRGWTTLSELSPGDAIAAPRRLSVSSRRTWPKHELVALAGLISEGNTCHPSSLYFYNNDRRMVDDFIEAAVCFPDSHAKIYARGDGRYDVIVNRAPERHVREDATMPYVVGDLALVMDAPSRRSGMFEWASRLGITGKKAVDKRVPAEIFTLRDEDLELFLGRLWSGDGFIAGEGANSYPFYATSSEGLARDVQLLLRRLGILSRMQSKRFRYRAEVRPGFTVRVRGEGAVETFVERIAPHMVGRDAALARLREHLTRTRRGCESKDTIPVDVHDWVDRDRRAAGLTRESLRVRSGYCYSGGATAARRGYRRSTIARVARVLGSLRLAQLASSDVTWDRIVSIEPRGNQDTYDLTVEHDHNFVANGLVVHNSHSAAYALLAYQSAYLKAHYPAEFMAATLTSELANSARIATLMEECRHMQLEVLPPDVNRSRWKFTLEGDRIRYALGAVRNVGQAAVEAIVAAREAAGPFRDLYDLAMRLDGRSVNRRVLECLVAAGACDSLGAERATLFAGAGRALEQAAALQRERESGQSSLFGDDHGVAVAPMVLAPAEPWAPRERSAREKEALGFYFSDHPLAPLRNELAAVSTHTLAAAATLRDGTEVRIAALVGEIRPLVTRAGKRMAAVIFEDLTGRMEGTVFPDAFEACRERLVADEIVVLAGRVENRDERGPKLLISEVAPWAQARAQGRPALLIEVHAEELSERWLEGVDRVLSSHPGESDVYLRIVMPDHSRQLSRSRRYRVAEGAEVVGELIERFPVLRASWERGLS